MDALKKITGDSSLPVFSPKKETTTGQISFKDTLKSLISQVDRQIKDADQMAEDFALGKKYDLHEIMIASEKADLSFKFLLRIRNKLLEAYQEIIRMNF